MNEKKDKRENELKSIESKPILELIVSMLKELS